MISQPWIKQRLLNQLGARPGMAELGLVYGSPEKAEETAGSDPLYRQMVGFKNPSGEYLIEDMCGVGVTTYEETYKIELVVQVIARTRDAGFFEVEARRGEILYQVSRVLQDPSMGFEDSMWPRIYQPRVTLEEFSATSGWLTGSGSNLAACQGLVKLEVSAMINGE